MARRYEVEKVRDGRDGHGIAHYKNGEAIAAAPNQKRRCEEMRIHFFTSPFYFAFIWFRVQGSRFKVQGSRGGFAAIIYGAMPDQESFSPLPLEGADERSEAGLASPRVKISLHAANLRPFGAPPSKGRREKSGVR